MQSNADEYYDTHLTDENVNKNNDISILPYKNNKFRHTFHVNSIYYKFIIGSKGAVINKLRSETRTLIEIPKIGSDVSITGSCKEDILSARNQIIELTNNIKKTLKFTHFVSIPTNTDEIKEIFNKVKQEILKNSEYAPRLTEGMFNEHGTLHLTLSMLLLLEDKDKQKAMDALLKCKQDIIFPIIKKSGPITIELKGIESMESNSTKTRVLYVAVNEETGCLQEMANAIFNFFLKQGLTRGKSNKVKLHMTIINVNNIKTDKQRFVKETFDATNILKDYKNISFGKMSLTTLHISQLGTRTEDGYYESIMTIDLPNF